MYLHKLFFTWHRSSILAAFKASLQRKQSKYWLLHVTFPPLPPATPPPTLDADLAVCQLPLVVPSTHCAKGPGEGALTALPVTLGHWPIYCVTSPRHWQRKGCTMRITTGQLTMYVCVTRAPSTQHNTTQHMVHTSLASYILSACVHT